MPIKNPRSPKITMNISPTERARVESLAERLGTGTVTHAFMRAVRIVHALLDVAEAQDHPEVLVIRGRAGEPDNFLIL